MSIISSSTTSTTAYKVTADTTGTLVLQTGASPTTAVTIDGLQNVGIGATPSAADGTLKYLTIGSSSNSFAGLNGGLTAYVLAGAYYNGGWKYALTGSAVSRYDVGAGAHTWLTASSGTAGTAITFTQAMTLDTSGNLLVGTTTLNASNLNGSALMVDTFGSFVDVGHNSTSTSGLPYARFRYSGTLIGSITQNGTTGVLYNLTSDYRLKNDQQPLTGAKEFVMALQPKKWQWWDGSGEGVGFIAHEFMEVAKYSGHGEKDAVDEKGNIIPQSIQPSSSEVMANLVAFIQELKAELDAAKADIATLKGAA
jgi:Chaperone of endosialidase